MSFSISLLLIFAAAEGQDNIGVVQQSLIFPKQPGNVSLSTVTDVEISDMPLNTCYVSVYATSDCTGNPTSRKATVSTSGEDFQWGSSTGDKLLSSHANGYCQKYKLYDDDDTGEINDRELASPTQGCYAFEWDLQYDVKAVSIWAKHCEDCDPGKYIQGCSPNSANAAASSGSCHDVGCPANSTGDNVASGCDCEAGYKGNIQGSKSTPYYTGSCKAVDCPANTEDGSSVPQTCRCKAGYAGSIEASKNSPYYDGECTPTATFVGFDLTECPPSADINNTHVQGSSDNALDKACSDACSQQAGCEFWMREAGSQGAADKKVKCWMKKSPYKCAFKETADRRGAFQKASTTAGPAVFIGQDLTGNDVTNTQVCGGDESERDTKCASKCIAESQCKFWVRSSHADDQGCVTCWMKYLYDKDAGKYPSKFQTNEARRGAFKEAA